MSVKKHYQKRNQELNKDLMKRWGYAPPEKPEPTIDIPPEKPEPTIDEGLFDSIKNPSRVARRNKNLGPEVDIPIGKEIEVGSASEAESDISVDAEKLKAFMHDHLLNLEKAGIGKDADLYRKVQKALKNAYVAIEHPPKEIEIAKEQPSSSPPSEEVVASNIAALEGWKGMWIEGVKDFAELRRVMQAIREDIGGHAVISKSDTRITVDKTINAIDRIWADVDAGRNPSNSDFTIITRGGGGGIKAKVDELIKKAKAKKDAEEDPKTTVDPETTVDDSRLELDPRPGQAGYVPEPIDLGN